MAFIEASDLAGFYKVPQDTNNTTISTRVIGEMRDPLIRRIFGAVLGNEIIVYIDTIPAPPANVELDFVINPFQVDLECGGMIESIGLKKVLLGFIYYQRICDMKTQAESVGGEVRPSTENSSNDRLPASKLIQRYNDSVKSIYSIQEYICKHREDYHDFNGQEFLLNYVL